MKHSAAVLVLLGALVSVAGCATGYSQFYKPYPNADQVAQRRVAPAPEEPAVERGGGDIEALMGTYMRRGYAPIGYSSFNSGMAESDSNAIEQGSDVGADLVVIIDPRHTDTTTTSIPVTTPTTTTSQTSSTATVYGSGGSATGYGNATTTTYGTKTTYLPMTVNRFDYGAIYFVKTRPRFGAYFRDLNDSERRELQTNKGAYITLIVDGSPAYDSDVLVGDVVVSFGDSAVNGADGLMDLIKSNGGQKVAVTILRNGGAVTKAVFLPE